MRRPWAAPRRGASEDAARSRFDDEALRFRMARKLWKDAENQNLDPRRDREVAGEKARTGSMEEEIRREQRGDARPSGRELVGSEGP